MNQEKVVHVSLETHKKLKRFCQKRGLKMKEFIETAIDTAMAAVIEVEKR